MKIAIQGHPTRGKEVIQILESLGGINRMNHVGRYDKYFYYISGDDNTIAWTEVRPQHLGVFTLEEFEKEFPFKIGDKILLNGLNKQYEIIALELYMDRLCYKLNNGLHYDSKVLTLYKKMKEERNVTLTLEKAKEWYKKGGELKEIALQAFTEQELNPFPRSWEEFCEKYPVKKGECILESKDAITVVPRDCRGNRLYKNWIPSQKSAEAHLALIQLEQLRDCWRQGWEPDWLEGNVQKYVIHKWRDRISIETTYVTHSFLSFPTYEMAKEFLECFKDLIEKAGDLI